MGGQQYFNYIVVVSVIGRGNWHGRGIKMCNNYSEKANNDQSYHGLSCHQF